MNKTLACCLFSTALFVNAFAQNNDPVIMTINGKSVYKSEFENVYKKNNGKEVNKESKSVKDYVDLFANFKMKVFEAEAMGLDTSAAFKQELAGYRRQLAAPYLTDKNVNDALLQEAYDRMKTEIRASHILIMCDENALPKDTLEAYTRTMLIRSAVLGKNISNGQISEYESILKKSLNLSKTSSHDDSLTFQKRMSVVKALNAREQNAGTDKFGAVAQSSSEDPSALDNKGDLGYFTAMQMVYPFETAAYKTNVGEISLPVRTRFGYHLIKVDDKRANQGEVLVAHIMVKFDKNMSEKDRANAKTKIDELYAKVKTGGEKFEDVARQFSDDKPSAEKGGQLQWFGSGRMPAEFEAAAFGLKNNGDIAEPIMTKYGWHIIKRIDKKDLSKFDDMKGDLKMRIQRDSRSQVGRTALIERVKKENNFKENLKNRDAMLATMDTTLFTGRWEAKKAEKLGNKELFVLGDKTYTQNDLAKFIEAHQTSRGPVDYKMFLNTSYTQFVTDQVVNYEDSHLEQKYPEFRNLLKEYRDGILLFDLTDQKVWSRAVKDTAGLKAFYEQNKNNYLWDTRAEVTTYKTANEKVANELRAMLKKKKSQKEIMETLNKDSQLNISSVEDVTFLKGENKNVDANWKEGIVANNISEDGKVLVIVVNRILPKSPKTIAEAKGIITADYQNYLEKEWLSYLKNKYTVKVDETVLSTVN